jgi:hypothetical protein
MVNVTMDRRVFCPLIVTVAALWIKSRPGTDNSTARGRGEPSTSLTQVAWVAGAWVRNTSTCFDMIPIRPGRRSRSRRLKRRSTNEDLGAVTISAGFAERLPAEPPTALMERADAALYVSKRTGRNRVSNAEERKATAA